VSQAFTLTNTGDKATSALTITLSGSAFTKTAEGCSATSLGKGKSCSVTVRYSPSGAGASDTGQLQATNKKKPPLTATLTLKGAGAVSRHIYWSNFSTPTIGRANVDGSSPNQSFISGVSSPDGVAVDSSHIYWTSIVIATIGRANLDGSSPNQSFISGASGPVGVVVDSSFIYWPTPAPARSAAPT
jgi:hypothetical protein